MGIELHPKFLNLTEQRRYQPPRESNVAKFANSQRKVLPRDLRPTSLPKCGPFQSFGRTVVWRRVPGKTGGYPLHLIF
jgi:hypothetical protein